MADTPRAPIVAIDGPAGSGKSTVARLVAARAGLQYINSGAMYRAVALAALRAGIDAGDADRLADLTAVLPIRFTTDLDGRVRTWVDEEDVSAAITTPEVSQRASQVAVIPAVRAHLVARQQAYGRDGGIVMEGRDIQTVVFPDAEIKVFLTASPEERAARRWRELSATGEAADRDAVLAAVIDRDRRDAERDVAPMRAASDAVLVDTDGCTIDEVVACLLRLIDAWRAQPALRGAALAAAAGCGRGA
jgi:cytidylate kinase